MTAVIIPAKARAAVYGVYGGIGLGLGATQVGFAAAEAGQPVWLTVSMAVFAFIGTGIGYTALTHTPTSDGGRRYLDADNQPGPDVR